LKIKRFVVTPKLIRVDYHLYDCLVFMLGIFSTPGGLITDQGHIEAKAQSDGSFSVEVLKEVQVKDLTPNDAGNRFDFGQTVNSMFGATLIQWVHDTSMLNPLT
jgi:hypothetical protein